MFNEEVTINKHFPSKRRELYKEIKSLFFSQKQQHQRESNRADGSAAVNLIHAMGTINHGVSHSSLAVGSSDTQRP